MSRPETALTPEIQTRARQIYRAALTCPPEERAEFLRRACGSDTDLREMLENLLLPDVATADTDIPETQIIAPPSAAERQASRHAAASTSPRRVLYTDDLSGHRVGAYELVRRIGKGGMGAVYAARRVDKEFQKLVAVKLVRPGTETEEILLRFKHERQVLAGLDHPNIARLLDGGTEAGVPYLVMEYVEGTPIDQYCRQNKLNVTERLRLFSTVCGAVQYAHQSLVVHRDIKPANIMVSTDGVPKLLDFGIAKVLNPDLSESGGMTKASERPMTPDYASPEQVRGEPITTASDIYSLGVLLYELLTTRHPLRHEYERLGFQKAITDTDPERPSTAATHLGDTAAIPEETPEKLRSRLRGDLDAILMTALRKEAKRRYASVQHFAEDIQRHLMGRPVRAHKDSFGYRATKFVRRNTGGVIAAVAVIIALIASSVISWAFYRTANVERKRAEARFNDVRQLAKFVLFDFDQVITAGVTPAREALIEKATEYLDRLEKDRGGDPSLARELVDGYLKVGDLQGNLYNSNLGDRMAARASYERALRVLETMRPSNPVLLAQTRVRLADLLAQSGLLADAIATYQAATTTLEFAGKTDPQTLRSVLEVLRKLGTAQVQAGDTRAALATYRHLLAVATDLLKTSPGSVDLRKFVALGEMRVGEARARLGEVDGGLAVMRRALVKYRDLAAASPESAAAQRPVAYTSALIADILNLEGRYREAGQAFREALEVTQRLREGDPRNEQYQRDTSVYSARLGDALARSGEMKEAISLTRSALTNLRQLVDRPEPSRLDLYQYAWILLTTPCVELRDGPAAVRYAEKLADVTKWQHPSSLDVLARAYASVGQVARAIEVEKKALELLPPGASSSLRTELERNLASFESRSLSSFRERKQD